MAGNSPWQVGPGDSDGVVIPNVNTGFFGATPVPKQTITIGSVTSNGVWTTAQAAGVGTSLAAIKAALVTLGLIET